MDCLVGLGTPEAMHFHHMHLHKRVTETVIAALADYITWTAWLPTTITDHCTNAQF
jgi:hypothetical protein